MKKVVKKVLKIFFTQLAQVHLKEKKKTLHVNFYSRFNQQTIVGENCHFNGFIIRGNGKVTIGDNFHSGQSCLVINSNHQYDNANAIPYDTTLKIDKAVTIEENVWIGDRVLILGGVTIGEGAIIQAGSVVSQNISKYAIAGGNPAVAFKYRDIVQYKRLKEEKKFC